MAKRRFKFAGLIQALAMSDTQYPWCRRWESNSHEELTELFV